MSISAVMRTMGLGVIASGAGLLASLYIVWIFGTAEFAIYTISLAKLAIILLGLEIVPSQFSIFRMQNDEEFDRSIAIFYVGFAALASVVTAVAVSAGIIVSHSWLIVAYAFLAVTQRYIEVRTQAGGIIPAFGRMPAINNLVRISILVILGLPMVRQQPADAIWASLCIGTAVAQVYMLSRFGEIQASLFRKSLPASIVYLFTVRREFYPYIINSILKRAKDTFIPLVVDAAVPNRSLAGRILIFFRASDAVSAQLRVLEMFLVNKNLRRDMRKQSRKLFLILSTGGLAGTFILSLVFQYRQGIDIRSVIYSLMIGTVMFPYVLELIWRNEAYAAFAPGRVTASLVAYLIGIAVPVGIGSIVGRVSAAVLIIAVVIAQSMSAATYYVWRRHRPLRSDPAQEMS